MNHLKRKLDIDKHVIADVATYNCICPFCDKGFSSNSSLKKHLNLRICRKLIQTNQNENENENENEKKRQRKQGRAGKYKSKGKEEKEQNEPTLEDHEISQLLTCLREPLAKKQKVHEIVHSEQLEQPKESEQLKEQQQLKEPEQLKEQQQTKETEHPPQTAQKPEIVETTSIISSFVDISHPSSLSSSSLLSSNPPFASDSSASFSSSSSSFSTSTASSTILPFFLPHYCSHMQANICDACAHILPISEKCFIPHSSLDIFLHMFSWKIWPGFWASFSPQDTEGQKRALLINFNEAHMNILLDGQENQLCKPFIVAYRCPSCESNQVCSEHKQPNEDGQIPICTLVYRFQHSANGCLFRERAWKRYIDTKRT